LKGRCKVDLEFSYTAAHEIGHNILRSYAEGGGSADYFINIKVLPDIQKQNLSVREVLYILVKEKLI
jgi:hypothetical protein